MADPSSTATPATSSDQSKIILGYWAIRGLAQVPRMLLEYTQQPYKEERYTAFMEEKNGKMVENKEAWFSVKHKIGLVFPNLPYLKDGDLQITQSNSIVRYIARKADPKYQLFGATLKDGAFSDMIYEQIVDSRGPWVRLCYSPKPIFDQNKDQVWAGLKEFYTKMSQILGDNKWLAKTQKPTLADFLFFEVMDQQSALFPVQKVAENLVAFYKRFKDLEFYSSWVKSDRYIDHPFNNVKATFK